MATPSWEAYDLQRAFPEEMADLAETLAALGEDLAGPLIAAGQTLQDVAAILEAFADPIAAALRAIIEEAEAFIQNLMETGLFFTYYMPEGLSDADLFANSEPQERGYKVIARPSRNVEGGLQVDMGNEFRYDFDGDGEPEFSVPRVQGVQGEPEFVSAAQDTLDELSLALKKFASVQEWCDAVADSVLDTADPRRPQFVATESFSNKFVTTTGQQARIGAVCIIFVAPSFADFIGPIKKILDILFNIQLNIPNLQPSDQFPAAGVGLLPDWMSMKIRDIPYMAELERVALSIIGLLRPGLELFAVIKALGELLELKGQQLQALAEDIAALLEALGEALAETGFQILKIDVKGDITEFQRALKESGNKPDLGGLDQVTGGVVLLVGGEDLIVDQFLDLF